MQPLRKEKNSVILLNERYNTPNTSLLLFHFDPPATSSTLFRLKTTHLAHVNIEGKNLYIFDNFFTPEEAKILSDYSRSASFSRESYASHESREQGETPARSMNNKEKWDFFSKPPQPIQEIYKLLSLLSEKLPADISTLPWDICDQNICASAVATNRLQHVSRASMEMGKHEDFNTEEGIPFGIPILYGNKGFFPGKFTNGTKGNPYLISFMLYAAEENFIPEKYGIGTVFCRKDGSPATKAACHHSRFVIFEGDILHTIEESKIPSDVNTWRVSYVYKLIINPTQPNQSMRDSLHSFLMSFKNN